MNNSTVNVMEERVLFARDIKPEVNACLQSAVACADDFERARELLYQARDMDPDQLEVYIALYKFLFYRGRLDEAEEVAEQALQRAAMRGGFFEDWQRLTSTSTDWFKKMGLRVLISIVLRPWPLLACVKVCMSWAVKFWKSYKNLIPKTRLAVQ